MKIADEAKGKWPAILPHLGVGPEFLSGKHGPCPLCAPGGAGKDRWRFTDQHGLGRWVCTQCGNGSGVDLVMKINGWEFKEAAREIAKHVGAAPRTPIRIGRDEAVVRAEMNDIWRGGKPLTAIRPAALYWTRRVGLVPDSAMLRGVISLTCTGRGDFAGFVAKVQDVDGKAVNLHRTYLAQTGDKADIPEPRRVMDTKLPKGCAVRLWPHEGVLGVAEGLETAVSCRMMFDMPVWALLNAQNMRGFVPPSDVRRVIVFGDLDHSFTGQSAAFDLARSLWAQRKKWDPELEVEVRIPGLSVDAALIGSDWNDVHRAEIERGR